MFGDAVDPNAEVLKPLIAEIASIAHDGKVVVVGTAPDGVLYFTVRQSGFENSALTDTVEQTLPGFENWKKMPLGLATDDPSVRAHEATNLVDQTGAPITRSLYGSEAERSAVGRVKLVSGLGHLYLFRVSTQNRLLMNRLVLDGMTNELVPKLEVRFRRSEQKLVPDGGNSSNGDGAKQDSLGFRDLEQNTFYEPTQELSFLGTFEAGKPWFSVELLPTSEHERHRWNFFVFTDGELRLVSAAASAEGLVDTKDQTKVQQDPDKVDKKVTRTIPGIVDRRLRLDGKVVDAFDSTLYHNQVERLTKAGPELLKENTRVMLSVPIEQSGREDPTVAAISFAVNSLGQLAQIDRVADRDELLNGDVKEVLLPLSDLEDVKLVADRTAPPEGSILKLSESQNLFVEIATDTAVDGALKSGQKVSLSGTRSYDGVYTARSVEDGTFEIDAVFDETEEDQGFWQVVEDKDKGLVFENMIASYERTETGGLKISCLSHNIEVGDEIRISGSVAHDGIYPISNVLDDNSFELDRVWPDGEVVNLSRRPRRGLAFDGKGDYLEIAPVGFPSHYSDARLERSISAWVYLSEVTDQPQTVFATKSGLLHLYVAHNGKLTFEVSLADGHTAKVVDTEPLQTEAWVHITAMLDYQGETTGETSLLLCRSGRRTAETIVEPRKPLHLPIRNLRLNEQALPISTLQYDMAQPEAVTLEAWISTRQTGRGVIASWYQNGLFLLAVHGDKTKRVVQWVTNGDRMNGTVHLPNDDWHHIAVTYDPAKGEKSIIVNGGLDSTKTAPPAVDDAGRALARASASVAKDTKKPYWLGFLGASAVETRATGRDVNTVHHSGGSFRQVTTRHWHQLDAAGKRIGDRLVETGRDDWSVYLRDDAESYRMMFDLHRKKLSRIDFNIESNVGKITSSVAVDGRNTNRVDYADGSWQRVDGNTWRRFDNAGQATSETLVENGRDQWSVYFPSPQGRQQFDLWRKKICLYSGGHRADVHDITGSAAPASEAETALNGANVRRVDFDGGRFESAGGRTWVQYNQSGNVVGKPFNEVNRAEWSVFFRDATGTFRIELDLWAKKVNRIDNQVKTDVHDVTGSAAPSKDPATTDRFDGFLADVRLWNRPRSETAIKGLWQERLTGTERSLIAHWPLEETSGPELSDATKSKAHVDVAAEGTTVAWFVEPHRAPGARSHYEGQSYEDTLTIASRLDYRDRHALELDGRSGHLAVPTMTEDLGDGFTVGAWARWDSFNHWSRIVDFGNGPGAENILLANEAKTNTLVFALRTGELRVPGALTAGEWVHVAVTVSGDGNAAIYLNGELRASGNTGIPDSSKRTKNYIGRSNWSQDGYFQGAMRDVQLWARPLAAHEVKYYMNTPAQGIEDGLLHHWPMRTATIKGKRRVVDQGTGSARHADIRKGASTERLSADLPPTPLTEFRGKLSDVQLWDVNRPIDTVRETMHDQLTGNEYGLVGYWRCGGLLQDPTPGSTRKVTPDFAADGHDARVVGDTYVSASTLPRRNSVGKAVRFSNDDLVAVTQAARYRESFEFRAVAGDGEFWTLGELDDADGRNNRIFEFSYWGTKTRTSDDRIRFRHDESYDFVDLGGGWFRAQCDVTIPDGVNMIRSFEVDEVLGLWSDEDEPPIEEWFELHVRKHRLELISNSMSRRSYTDDLDLPTLVDNASELEDAIRKIPAKEREIAVKRVELDEVLEALLVFSNRAKFEEERNALNVSTRQLTADVAALDAQIAAFPGDFLNYRYMFWAKEAGKVLDYSGQVNAYIWGEHAQSNQAWEFRRTDTEGHYRIACVSSGTVLTITRNSHSVYLSGGDGPHHRWTVIELGGGFRAIRNVATGSVLDVYAHGRNDGSLVTTWGRNGRNNQAWEFKGWFPGLADVKGLEANSRGLRQHARAFAGHHHGAIEDHLNTVADAFDTHARTLRAAYPDGRQRKSTYDAEVGVLNHRRKQANDRLVPALARLNWLNGALANTTAAHEQALIARRDLLEQEVRRLQDEINQLNTDYIETAKLVMSDAQTMALVAEDPLGLKTYGAVLGFAAPISGLTSAATAEGNVQLSYFDSQGRMRFTNYDATSDSTNAAYEQWLPSTISVCPDLSRSQALLRLEDGSPIALNPTANTTEAWFYYPLPFQDNGKPYPFNQLTSDATGQEAAIAIAGNRRLGTIVDGFFHDAGIDLTAGLDTGWHHVAARTEGSVTLFYLDGEPVGHDTEAQLAIDRHALVLAGEPAHLQVGAMAAGTHNYAQGFSVQAWVRIDERGQHSRIIDFGNGVNVDCIVFYTGPRNDDLHFFIEGGQISANGVLPLGQWVNVAATVANGIGVIYLDGVEVARGELANPSSVTRTSSYVGRSNWHVHGDTDWRGSMSDVHVWNRGLSRAEVQRFMFEPATGQVGLLHHWPMSTKEAAGGGLEVVDAVESSPVSATMVGSTSTHLLQKTVSAPIVAIGNRLSGGAPAGKLSEVRVWSEALPDEEIKINSLINLTGNEPDLEACYPLNDIIGSEGVARDITGKHRAATLQAANPIARTAKVGNPGAMVTEFDGVSAQATVAGVNLAERSFTIEFWIKRATKDRGEWIAGQGRHAQNEGLHIGFRPDNQYAFAFYANDINHQVGDLGVNDWVHVANVYDLSTTTQRLYINGKQVTSRSSQPLRSSGDLYLGSTYGPAGHFKGNLAEFRVWNHARTTEQVADGVHRRAVGGEAGLIAYLPLDDAPITNRAAGGAQPTVSGGSRLTRTDDLPIAPGPNLVTAEYNTVGADPMMPSRQRAVLRRFYGFADDAGRVALLPGKRIEELVLKWIGNAQFEPTLLGYMEGAPPVPSENLTINYDYDAATTIELIQSDETMYSWNRNRDIGGGLDANFFLGAGWSLSGGAFIESQISEGHLGARGSINTQWRRNESSTIRASSTQESRDRLDLRGAYEIEPKFPHLGNRFVPKNVGYALVVSGLADVFITQMKRTGRMVAYEVLPVEDVPPDVNTITFMINPSYTLNGSLDGLVGSQAADDRFFKHVPEMRAQYGSRYPASYYNLEQAYDLKSQIDRWDKERESYFVNFDARETGLSDSLLDQIPGEDEADDFGQVEVDDGSGEDGAETNGAAARDDAEAEYKKRSEGGKDSAKKRRAEIEKRFADQSKQMEANAAFVAWQRRMEGLQIRAAKRNIVNTYVWDADGGIRFEEQSFANTIEHTIGGSFSLNASLGLDANVTVSGFKFELQAMGTFEMSQTMSKTSSATRSFDLNVRLDGVEKKGVTDPDDYPVMPGEKVDRYRFMSFYLEGDTDHFNDFFNYVVDPEWLMSNDEEARALRQVARGRPNKTWRVMHRVTYVERPALMGIGQDLRVSDDMEQATEQVFNYFDALEQNNESLSADIGGLRSQLTQIEGKLNDLSETQRRQAAATPPPPAGTAERAAPTAPASKAEPDASRGKLKPAAAGGNSGAILHSTPGVHFSAAPTTSKKGPAAENGQLDLNTATLAQLEQLTGVGPSMAKSIVDLRKTLGGFPSIDTLTQVSGIGASKLKQLRPFLAPITPKPDTKTKTKK